MPQCLTATKRLAASTVSPPNFRKGDSLIKAKHADRVCFSFLFFVPYQPYLNRFKEHLLQSVK